VIDTKPRGRVTFYALETISKWGQQIAAAPGSDLEKLDDELERVKWYLWHGNVFRALQMIERIQWKLEDLDEEVPASRKLARSVAEFHAYITANEPFIPNYGDATATARSSRPRSWSRR
jgi:hypothetical protein